MAATRVRFSFHGDVQIDRTFTRMEEAVSDARPAWEEMAKSFQRAERRQFSTEGGYGSGGWPALSDAYARWKAQHYPGRPILVRTGDLKRSLTERPFGVEVIEPRFAMFGSAVRYAPFHQHGGGRLPRRPPVELPESVRRDWVKIIQRFIVTGYASARPHTAAAKLRG